MTVIYQITDTHIPLEADHVAQKNFLTLMRFVHHKPADLLVISGDLPGVDGSLEIYQWIKDQIPANQTTYVIPGNHDDADNMYQVFGAEMCGNREFLFTLKLDEIDVVFTNTGSTVFPKDHLAYIQDPSIRTESILFTHFPTKKLSDGYMDTHYPLGNITEADLAISSSHIRHVFCGHFHTEHRVRDAYELNVIPSPAFTVELNSAEIKIGKPRIPLCIIEVTGKQVQSSVLYLDHQAPDLG